MGGTREQDIVAEQSERRTKSNIKSKNGKTQPEKDDVTRSTSELTSEMMSEQEFEIDTENRNTKAKPEKDSLSFYSASSRLKEICSNYASSIKEPALKTPEIKPKDQEPKPSEQNDDFPFEFSKRLIALAREKQTTRKRKRSESKRFSRKRKATEDGGSHGNGVAKRRRQRSSQPEEGFEETEDLNDLEKAQDYEKKLMKYWPQREVKMKLRRKRNSDVGKTAPMDYEFSRRLTELSRKNQRYQSHEHAHCCRCVQSFECFWPRSNLQTIRRQAFC